MFFIRLTPGITCGRARQVHAEIGGITQEDSLPLDSLSRLSSGFTNLVMLVLQ
jgi:hypothetical protein